MMGASICLAKKDCPGNNRIVRTCPNEPLAKRHSEL